MYEPNGWFGSGALQLEPGLDDGYLALVGKVILVGAAAEALLRSPGSQSLYHNCPGAPQKFRQLRQRLSVTNSTKQLASMQMPLHWNGCCIDEAKPLCAPSKSHVFFGCLWSILFILIPIAVSGEVANSESRYDSGVSFLRVVFFMVLAFGFSFPSCYVKGACLGLQPRLGVRAPWFFILVVVSVCVCISFLCAYLNISTPVCIGLIWVSSWLATLIAGRFWQRIDAKFGNLVWVCALICLELLVFAIPFSISYAIVGSFRRGSLSHEICVAIFPFVLAIGERVCIATITFGYRCAVFKTRLVDESNVLDDQKAVVAYLCFCSRIMHSCILVIALYSIPNLPLFYILISCCLESILLAAMRSIWLQCLAMKFFQLIFRRPFFTNIVGCLLAPTSFSVGYTAAASIAAYNARFLLLFAFGVARVITSDSEFGASQCQINIGQKQTCVVELWLPLCCYFVDLIVECLVMRSSRIFPAPVSDVFKDRYLGLAQGRNSSRLHQYIN